MMKAMLDALTVAAITQRPVAPSFPVSSFFGFSAMLPLMVCVPNQLTRTCNMWRLAELAGVFAMGVCVRYSTQKMENRKKPCAWVWRTG